MDKQLIFNQVVSHLRNQGIQSKIDNTSYYHHPKSNLKCAIGCLIPDSEYDPSFEGQVPITYTLSTDFNNYLKKKFGKQNINLLVDLQNLHDFSVSSDWENGFVTISTKYNLKMN